MPRSSSPYSGYARIKRKASERAMRRREVRACRRHWYATAVPEVMAGVWILLLGVICLATMTPTGINRIGLSLCVCTLLIPILLPRLLEEEFVIPSGLLIRASGREPVSRSLTVITALVYGAGGAWGIMAGYSSFVLAGCLLALMLLALYAFCGASRLFFLSIWAMVSCGLAPVLAALLGLPLSGGFGFAMLLFGGAATISGIGAFLRPYLELADEQGEVMGSEASILLMDEWFTPDEIVAALRSNDSDIRYLTCAFLCTYLEPQILPQLLLTAFDDDVAVASVARRALASIWGPDVDTLFRWQIEQSHGRKRLFGDDQIVITRAQIDEINRERIQLERDSKRHEHEVEQVMYEKVAGDEKALDALIRLALLDDAGGVRYVAMELLGSTRSHRAYATLVEAITRNGADRQVVSAASEGFRGASSSAVVHLEPLFQDRREWVRVAACNACIGLIDALEVNDRDDAHLARSMLHDTVFFMAQHGHPVTRATILELLAYYGDEALSTLEASCRDRFAFVRGEGIRALTLMDGKRARSFVMEALEDSRAYVRSSALNCVAYLRLSEAQALVEGMVDDSDDMVASLAKRLLLVFKLW